ncbi:MAG: hypothetical protein R2852_02120 [Bacteroidia bacterium]
MKEGSSTGIHGIFLNSLAALTLDLNGLYPRMEEPPSPFHSETIILGFNIIKTNWHGHKQIYFHRFLISMSKFAIA